MIHLDQSAILCHQSPVRLHLVIIHPEQNQISGYSSHRV